MSAHAFSASSGVSAIFVAGVSMLCSAMICIETYSCTLRRRTCCPAAPTARTAWPDKKSYAEALRKRGMGRGFHQSEQEGERRKQRSKWKRAVIASSLKAHCQWQKDVPDENCCPIPGYMRHYLEGIDGRMRGMTVDQRRACFFVLIQAFSWHCAALFWELTPTNDG